jgi:hypothetical protein
MNNLTILGPDDEEVEVESVEEESADEEATNKSEE